MALTDDSNDHLKPLAYGPLNYAYSHNGYFINGYKFHTLTHGHGRVTNNSGICMKGACYDQFESDYYGLLEDEIEVKYHSSLGPCKVVLFKCRWFDTVRGVRADSLFNLVDIKHNSNGCVDDPFILASQAQQVY